PVERAAWDMSVVLPMTIVNPSLSRSSDLPLHQTRGELDDQRHEARGAEGQERGGHPASRGEADGLPEGRPRRSPPGDVPGVNELVDDEPDGPWHQHRPAGPGRRGQV